MAMRIRVLRGPENFRPSILPLEGELLYTTDEKKLYVGDGVTPGGKLVYAPWDEPYDLNDDPLGLIDSGELHLLDIFDQYHMADLNSALTLYLPSTRPERAPRGAVYIRLAAGGSLTVEPNHADWAWEKAASADPDPTMPTGAGATIILRYTYSPVLGMYYLTVATV